MTSSGMRPVYYYGQMTVTIPLLIRQYFPRILPGKNLTITTDTQLILN
jgi:hypothetical protein